LKKKRGDLCKTLENTIFFEQTLMKEIIEKIKKKKFEVKIFLLSYKFYFSLYNNNKEEEEEEKKREDEIQ
jgi:hypothetical protein